MASRRPGVKEISVNLDREDFELVEALSKSHNLSRSAIVRKMVSQAHQTLLAARELERRDEAGTLRPTL